MPKMTTLRQRQNGRFLYDLRGNKKSLCACRQTHRPDYQAEGYFPRVRVVTSKITAAARTAPLTMYCIEISMPIRFMPLVRDIITSAPISEPVTRPMPPAGDTPPINAAAMASSSNSVPAVVVADFRRDANRMPDKADSMPIDAKTI